MNEKIEAPNEDDINYVAKFMVLSHQIAMEALEEELDGSLEDLNRLQKIIDSGKIDSSDTLGFQSLGIALGKIIVENNEGYDWWMVQDDLGRDACICYLQTTLKIFPQTMISKRIEEGEAFTVPELYNTLMTQLSQAIKENFSS